MHKGYYHHHGITSDNCSNRVTVPDYNCNLYSLVISTMSAINGTSGVPLKAVYIKYMTKKEVVNMAHIT